jgi:hypothetical protein
MKFHENRVVAAGDDRNLENGLLGGSREECKSVWFVGCHVNKGAVERECPSALRSDCTPMHDRARTHRQQTRDS